MPKDELTILDGEDAFPTYDARPPEEREEEIEIVEDEED